jgi:hypothetical protein
MADQIQNLSMELIEKASEKYANIREVVIQMEVDGEVRPFKVEIYKVFSPVGIQQCVAELVEKIDIARSKDKNGFGNIIIPYTIFLIIKHFTTLKLPNVFSQQIKAIEHMINTGILFQIFMYFDEEEVNKIRNEIMFVLDNFDKKLPEIEKLKAEIREKLINKDLVE